MADRTGMQPRPTGIASGTARAGAATTERHSRALFRRGTRRGAPCWAVLALAAMVTVPAGPAAADETVTTRRALWTDYKAVPGPWPLDGLPERYGYPTNEGRDLLGPLGANVVGNIAGPVIRVIVPERPPGVEGLSAEHVAACSARFRSYDPVTDTYTALSGTVRRCPL